MARNITEFTVPADTSVDAADLIHLGRTSLPAAQQDIKLTGAQFFESMNYQQAIYGAPQLPLVMTANTRHKILDFQSEFAPAGSVVDRVLGTITVPISGTFKVDVLLVMSAPNQNGFNIAAHVTAATGGDFTMSAMAIASRAGAGDLMSFSGTTLVELTAGHELSLEVEPTASLTGLSYINGSFIIAPIALL